MSLQIRFLGVRGSLPTPYYPEILEDKIIYLLEVFSNSEYCRNKGVKNFLESIPAQFKKGYGGNTVSVEVCSPNNKIIIDGGTGIRVLAQELIEKGIQKSNNEIHLFFTHFHWDHIMGLPFFLPLFIKGTKINIYSVQKDAKKMMETVFSKNHFPVNYKKIKADVIYHHLKPRKPFQIGDISVTPYKLDHPDVCWGYKVESNGKVYSHCVDTECIRVSRKDLGKDLPLYQNVDLMAFDAQYTFQEAQEKNNWGHSSANKGFEIALREKIKKVVFIHHDPWASDQHIANIFREAHYFYEEKISKPPYQNKTIDWYIGYDGITFNL